MYRIDVAAMSGHGTSVEERRSGDNNGSVPGEGRQIATVMSLVPEEGRQITTVLSSVPGECRQGDSIENHPRERKATIGGSSQSAELGAKYIMLARSLFCLQQM